MPTGPAALARRVAGYASLAPGLVRCAAGLRKAHAESCDWRSRDVPDLFWGINVCPGRTDEYDDYVVERLKELGLRCVRVDYGYGKESRVHGRRFIHRLLDEGFEVLLHLVQPRGQAWRMGSPRADERWRKFVNSALTEFDGKIAQVELTSAVNRFGWCGHTMQGCLRAIEIGADVCEERGVEWLAPNVTDFSPLFNAGLLGRLAGKRLRPAAHTNNLFVDRAGQPEDWDTKIFENLADRIRLDVVGKARILAAISRRFGIERTYSTYNYWTLEIKSAEKPRYVTEEKFADYLVRYLVLGLAGGHLDRIYWGQMISHAKGLIGDGSEVKPRIPTVHHQWLAFGELDNYTVRPGFHAYAHLVRALRGARFEHRLKTGGSTFAFDFAFPGDGDDGQPRRLLIAWTRDGWSESLAPWFEHRRNDIEGVVDLHGTPVDGDELSALESPRFVTYRGPSIADAYREESCGYLGRLKAPPDADSRYHLFSDGGVRGILRDDLPGEAVLGILRDPSRLLDQSGVSIIKKSRRRLVAEFSLETADGERRFLLAAKTNRRMPGRRGRSHGARMWDAVCRVLERGQGAPPPAALLESSTNPESSPSCVLFECVEGSVSMRAVLHAIRKGQPLPIDKTPSEFLVDLGNALRHMHKAGVFHRDLMGKRNQVIYSEGKLRLLLVDVSGARFFRRVSMSRRLRDLARMRLPLEDRRLLFERYMGSDENLIRKYWWRFRLGCGLQRAKYRVGRIVYPIKRKLRKLAG